VTPFHHLSGESHLHRSLGAGPITASRLKRAAASKRLLRRVGTERGTVQAVTCAAGAEASHRLHELANVTGVTSRRIDGETAELCAPTRRWLTTGLDLRF
jgi:hypothetical protein